MLLACNPESKKMVIDTIWMDIAVNAKITLKNIYYDFDKWDILAESAKELDQLVSLMNQNPGMKVELGSHTDDRGTEIYNMKLSHLRAQSAVDYIVSKGISRTRIKGTGYGKSQLIHKASGLNKCTPEQNRENRRTEIYIPGFLRGESVRQQTGDYSNGKPNASKEYSSFKEHGNLLKTDVLDQKATTVANVAGILKYYLILGSFQTETKAAELVQQLNTEGHQATVLREPGKYRIGIGFGQLSEAKKKLEILKDKYVGAWILKMDN
jgi:hypothetical protein